jgi:Fe-S-cluster containining protein
VNELPSRSPDLAEPHALCGSCGLCCDGTLYGSVSIDASEVPRLERGGLSVVRRDALATMPQPCSALRGCLCSVYADRPSACARYECALLKQVDAGSRSLAEALAAVARVKSLLGIVRADLEIDPHGSVWEAILALEAPKTAEEERAWALRHAGALQAVVELVEVVRADFDARFGGGRSAR